METSIAVTRDLFGEHKGHEVTGQGHSAHTLVQHVFRLGHEDLQERVPCLGASPYCGAWTVGGRRD